MPTLQDLQAQDAAYAKAGNDAQTAEQAKQTLGSTGQPNGILSWMTQMPRRITSDMIDSAVRAADSMAHDGSWGEAATRVGRDVAAGAADAVANTGDAAEELVRNGARATYESVAHPQQAALEAEDPAMLARDRMLDGSSQTSPIWQHARNAILDFRDAVAVKDPNAVDDLTQTAAQLAIPFAGYSKALSGVHDVALAALGVGKVAPEISAMQPFGDYLLATAKRDLGVAGRYVAKKAVGYATKVAAPGAMTDSTALAPHAGRLADTIALGRHVEGKFGEVLRALAPDGSLQDEYIRYLTNPDETAAEGRWKNVLDGQMAGAIATPLLEAVAPVLKQGTAGLRYLIDNGVPSMDKFPSPRLQRGAIGDLSKLEAPKIKFSNEKGLVAVQSPNGFTHARPTGEGNWRVFKSETSQDARGQGEGYARLKRAADEAHAHGALLESDHQVSAPEARLYARLKADGYRVKQNAFEHDPGTGELRSTSELKPVFVVGPGEMH